MLAKVILQERWYDVRLELGLKARGRSSADPTERASLVRHHPPPRPRPSPCRQNTIRKRYEDLPAAAVATTTAAVAVAAVTTVAATTTTTVVAVGMAAVSRHG